MCSSYPARPPSNQQFSANSQPVKAQTRNSINNPHQLSQMHKQQWRPSLLKLRASLCKRYPLKISKLNILKKGLNKSKVRTHLKLKSLGSPMTRASRGRDWRRRVRAPRARSRVQFLNLRASPARRNPLRKTRRAMHQGRIRLPRQKPPAIVRKTANPV